MTNAPGYARASSKPANTPSMLQHQQSSSSHPKSGQKKKRGINGAKGAAGTIMASNIANMGYQRTVPGHDDVGTSPQKNDGKKRTNDLGMNKFSHITNIGGTTQAGLGGFAQQPVQDHHNTPQSYSHKRAHREHHAAAHSSSHATEQNKRRLALIAQKQSTSTSSVNESHLFAADIETRMNPGMNQQASTSTGKNSNNLKSMALKKNASNTAHGRKSNKSRGMSGLVSGAAMGHLAPDTLKQNNFLAH